MTALMAVELSNSEKQDEDEHAAEGDGLRGHGEQRARSSSARAP